MAAAEALKGSVAIVTGGSSGIGWAVAERLVDLGATVYVADIQAPIKSLPGTSYVQCDTSLWESQRSLFDTVARQEGHIDIVIGNAGVSDRANKLPFLAPSKTAEPVQPVLRSLEINLTGTLYTVSLAVHHFRANPSAPPRPKVVVLTASVGGLYPFPFGPIYAAGKHAVVGLTRSLAPTLALEGIRINSVGPAVVETNLSPSSTYAKFAITPMSTIVGAFEHLVTSDATGIVAEGSGSHAVYLPAPQSSLEETKQTIQTFDEMALAAHKAFLS